MTNGKRDLEQVPLRNGLTVYFQDCSKALPGSRAQVVLDVSVPVDIRSEYLQNCDDTENALRILTEAYGTAVPHTVRKVRNFVANEDFEEVLMQMRDEYLRCNVDYLSRPSFASRFLSKKLEELRSEQSWRDAHARALSRMEAHSDPEDETAAPLSPQTAR